MVDPFLKLEFGNIVELDIHGKTLEDARAELLFTLNSIDSDVDAILVIHGFNKGTILKNWLRTRFKDDRILKIVRPDAGVTLLVLAKEFKIR